MKIDLRKLYALNELEINEEIEISKDNYTKLGIIRMSKVLVKGSVKTDYENNLVLNLEAKGNFIMPCAISLEEVEVPFDAVINETIEENMVNEQFYLDLFDILWENIVLEIPIRVVKEGIQRKPLHGEGWQLDTEK